MRALRERNSVILVPGGQAELIHTGRLFTSKEFVIYPRHKGVPLLPLCSTALPPP